MKDKILILGIESSCDETACAVVENGTVVLSNIVASQVEIHKRFGGVVPEIASRNHIEAIFETAKSALKEAKVDLADLSAVAVTKGGGLVGALFVGVSFAKGLSLATSKPLVAVNHIEGHICANFISNKNLTPPFVSILASGGHTSIVLVNDFDRYTVLCETVDDACGEAFDKIARVLGLPYPGGAELDKLSKNGKATVPFKTVALKDGNFSYSGLKTAALNFLHNAEQRKDTVNRADFAKSVIVAGIEGLVLRAKQEAQKHNLTRIAASGGVAANSFLRESLQSLSNNGFEIFLPELKFCGDNAAMIASRGYFHFLKGEFANMTLTADPSL